VVNVTVASAFETHKVKAAATLSDRITAELENFIEEAPFDWFAAVQPNPNAFDPSKQGIRSTIFFLSALERSGKSGNCLLETLTCSD
jgi:hypothetical protein